MKCWGYNNYGQLGDGTLTNRNTSVYVTNYWGDTSDGIGNNADADDDNDNLTDVEEPTVYLTDPLLPDTDADGASDSLEITVGTNPFLSDTDADGANDNIEITSGTNPLLADTDADGVNDGDELALGSNPFAGDTDGDSLGVMQKWPGYRACHRIPMMMGSPILMRWLMVTAQRINNTDNDGVMDGMDGDPLNPLIGEKVFRWMVFTRVCVCRRERACEFSRYGMEASHEQENRIKAGCAV